MNPQVRATLIHRCLRGPQPWWRNPVVYEFLGMLDASGVEAATRALPTVAEMGVQAVLIRPAHVCHESELASFKSFVETAHRLNLRVITRISGASRSITGRRSGDIKPFVGCESDTETTLERARIFLDHGSDGLDLGMFVETAMAPEDETVSSRRLTEFIETLREMIRTTKIPTWYNGEQLGSAPRDGLDAISLGGAATTALPELMMQRLDENLLHNLRDDTLVRVPFQASVIRERLAQMIQDRDRRGVLLAWYCSPAFVRTRCHNPAGRIGWYSLRADDEAKRLRSQAMDLLLLAMPGAVYLHGGDEVALVDEQHPIDEDNPRASEAERIAMIDEMARSSKDDPESPWRIHRRALRVRRDFNLNGGTLAWVDDGSLNTDDVLTLMSGPLLIMLNTSDQPISVSAHWQPLVSSAYVHFHRHRNEYTLPAGACAWFEQLPDTYNEEL